MSKHRRGSVLVWAVAVAVASASCAKVSVRKVGDPDGPEGLRFYMPRPYVAVNEPFVVSSRAYLVGGELTLDKQFVLINDVNGNTTGVNGGLLDDHFFGTIGRRIPASRIIAAPETNGGFVDGREQALVDASPIEKAENADSNKAPAGATIKEKTGTLDYKMRNDNSAYAVTPMRRYFDIVWLPDFDEQYVVSGKAGLGNAGVSLSMGQGWNLQGLDVHVDNSAIADRLFELYDNSMEILTTLGQAAAGPGGVLAGLVTGSEQGVAPTADGVFEGGTPLTIKVTIVRVVAPGLYPVLKPSELGQLAEDFGKGHLQALATEDKFRRISDRILIPIPPMTNIAFNTYEVAVVEAARADGDSAMRLHQYVLGADANLAPGVRPWRVGEGWSGDKLSMAREAINVQLKSQADSNGAYWTVSTLKMKDGSPGRVAVVVKPNDATTPSLTKTLVVDTINAELTSHGLTADAGDVELRP